MNEYLAITEEGIAFLLFLAMGLGLMFSLMLEDCEEEPIYDEEDEDDDKPLF